MQKDYYVGVDIGTDSVGYAVTDCDYRLLKKGKNAMWGIRLFDESNTAEERRGFRTARRRTLRKKQRLNMLELLFDKEICGVDPAFFTRLSESNLYLEDKSLPSKFCVFTGEYTDKDFHKAYPTVYHLRKALICDKSPKDIRLVYLALHHIIKNRGHFLFDALGTGEINDFSAVYTDLVTYLDDNYEIHLNCIDVEKLEATLKNKRMSKTAKNTEITGLFSVTKKENPQGYACLCLLSGSSVKLCDVYDDELLKDAEKKNVTFATNFSDEAAIYEAILGEKFELLEKLKAVYDWAVLADILDGEKYISFAKVKVYEQHQKDLQLLKKYVKTNMTKSEYNALFKISKEKTANYVAYSGHSKKNGKTNELAYACTQQEFCDYLKKNLKKSDKEEYADMFDRIETGVFMPKQVNKDNGVIPMQVHRAELEAILNNAKEYLTFLNQIDGNGIAVCDKILSIFDYRIPYYVGPLNKHSDKAWLERNDEKIYPWNFESVVDLDKSAENFIENLTSRCKYLPQCDVIPKNSLLYCKFAVLNQLNTVKIDGKLLTVQQKQDVFNDLFLNKSKVTITALKNYIKSKTGTEVESVEGVDGDFTSNMKPYIALKEFTSLDYEDKEEIIKAATVFGDDKGLFKKRVAEKFGDKLSQDELKKVTKLKFAGWGNLSKEFLTKIESVDTQTGEVVNIITALWQTDMNLMQIIYSDRYDFERAISKISSAGGEKTLKDAVDELYVSPKVKRPIYQALQIVREIQKIQKCPPKKIFVEVARGGGEKGKRTISRKANLMELYKACKKEYEDVYKELTTTADDEFRIEKLYLYFTQFGRCMYSGEAIDLNELMTSNSNYDIDHIYPRSKIKDDSFDNRVLVKKQENAEKTNIYPLDGKIQGKMTSFWKLLKDRGLITQEKYLRLVRTTELKDDELGAFISRQIVETSQSTKAVAQILEVLYPNTPIVYVKASLVSEFRQENDMLKSRDVNDFHHAKDAYLNIVVGNVYDVKVTRNKANFINGLKMNGKDGYSLNAMYSFSINGAWDKNTSLETVKNTMEKNNILYTRYAFKQKGGLFDQNLLKKGKGQVPIKANSPRSDINKYGGYNRASSCYFAFIKYVGKKGDEIRAFVPVDSYIENEYLENPSLYLQKYWDIENAEILIPCVKYNSLISVDGFRMHISSKSSGGAAIVYKPAMQLVLGSTNEKYVKRISNYLTKYAYRQINARDKLTPDENIMLFDLLCDKMTKTILKVKFGSIGKKIIFGREKFVMLNTETQCKVIMEILKILHSNVMTGDLSAIDGAGKSGAVTTSSAISEIKGVKSIKLIHQSVTGLFEQEVDLLNM